MTMREAGLEGRVGTGRWYAQRRRRGLVVRPAKGGRSRVRVGTGGVGAGVGRHVVGAIGHISWNMRPSHPRAISTNGENKRPGPWLRPLIQVEQ
jgi:hypothetical protein